MRKTLALCVLICAFTVTAHATTVSFVTPTGSTIGGQPVSDQVTFTTGAGTVSITLSDLLVNPTDVGQLLSDLFFTLSNGATTGTLASSSAQEITVNSNGTFSLGPTVSTGWGLNQNVNGGLQLSALGFPIAPAHLIIGPPGAGGYTNANGSIAGNGPHNPFLNGTATFLVNVTGVTATTSITSATFSFGTTAGSNVVGVPQTVPEPASIISLAIAVLFVGALSRVRKRTTLLQED